MRTAVATTMVLPTSTCRRSSVASPPIWRAVASKSTSRRTRSAMRRSSISCARITCATRLPACSEPSAHGAALAEQRARDDQLLNLRRAVADLPAENVAEPLLDGQPAGVAQVTVEEEALVDGLGRHLRRPPLHHRRLGGAGDVVLAHPEDAVALPARQLEVRRGR